MAKSPIDELLISPPTQPDNPAWSPVAHAMDDLVRRAAWHSLTLSYSGGQIDADRERHERQRQACIDGAKKIATDGGWMLATSLSGAFKFGRATPKLRFAMCDSACVDAEARAGVPRSVAGDFGRRSSRY